MKHQIKNRYTDAVLFECEVPEDVQTSGFAMRLALEQAVKSGADLRFADMCGADLRFADMCGADLRFANLIDANLIGADLRGANLIGANLIGAVLPREPETGLLQKVAHAALTSSDALEMNGWHTCETTHCIAGWACHLTENKTLEKTHGTQVAGLLLLGAEAHSHFFDSNNEATKYLKSVLKETK